VVKVLTDKWQFFIRAYRKFKKGIMRCEDEDEDAVEWRVGGV